MTDDKPTNDDKLLGPYRQALKKLSDQLVALEDSTWKTIQDEIDTVVEFEAEVAELTKEEAALLNAYLQRDLKQLNHYLRATGKGLLDWLQIDVDLLEEQALKALKQLADQTQLGQLSLQQRLNHDESIYMAGEVACPGVLRCQHCESEQLLTESAIVTCCEHCGGNYFYR